jgi:hypothetical protein
MHYDFVALSVRTKIARENQGVSSFAPPGIDWPLMTRRQLAAPAGPGYILFQPTPVAQK